MLLKVLAIFFSEDVYYALFYNVVLISASEDELVNARDHSNQGY